MEPGRTAADEGPDAAEGVKRISDELRQMEEGEGFRGGGSGGWEG